MNTFKCLVIDDEPIARDIIQAYCGHLKQLQVVASCGNALEAKQLLQEQRIDILFLDINMPVIDGISFAKTLRHAPQVIFTTAYKEYAHHAFDLAACDYLLKPFSLDRFIIAVDKAIDKIGSNAMPVSLQPNPEQKADDFIFIKTEGKIYKIFHQDLLFAEAQGNYTRICTATHTLLPKMPFTNFEELLPKSLFLRAHRSFIINKAKISHIEGNRVYIDGKEIPIGSKYREILMYELGFSK